MTYTAYFDRYTESIDGYFTLQKEGLPVFKRLAARSGQKGHTHTSWTRGKSPVPFGEYYLWIDRPVAVGTRAGYKGIGEFYAISSGENSRRLIINPKNPNERRSDIGLHAENALPGSAGCIVLVDADQAYDKVFPYLRDIGQGYIKLVVL